jgi:assimilatory nitrate reductase catalytic subunit
MGSRLFSNTTNLLGGHDFTNPAHRLKIANTLGIPASSIPAEPSWAYDQIIDGIESGAIRGLWMIATNAAHSWIHQLRIRDLVRRLEFFVVQDMYSTTETAQLAHLLLPAAGWGEKEGTFINSERRFGVSRQVARAPGQALSDFRIVRLLADTWGCGDMFKRWSSPAAAFEILKECTQGQPCDITGIDDLDAIEQAGGIQWPWPGPATEAGPPAPRSRRSTPTSNARAAGRPRRLFEDGTFFTPDRRARFVFESPRPVPEPTDHEFPFILLTGRGSSAQWHTGTRTGKSKILRALHAPDLAAEMNPEDAARLGIPDGAPARVSSRRGTLIARARLTATVQQGQVFLPMHDPRVNQLTAPSFDPHSRQPGYKHCAVRVCACRPNEAEKPNARC